MPQIIWSLTAAVTIVAAAVFGLSPLLPDIAASFGRSMQQAGALVSGFGASLAFSAPLIGLWGRHWPRAAVMAGGLVVAGLGWAMATQVPTWALASLAIGLSGCGVGAVLPSAYALAADLSTDQTRGKINGRVVAGWALANLLVVPLLAWAGAVVSWREALLGSAAAAWGLAVVVLWMQRRSGLGAQRGAKHAARPDAMGGLDAGQSVAVPGDKSVAVSRATREENADSSGTWQVLGLVMRNRKLRVLLAANLLDMAAYYGIST